MSHDVDHDPTGPEGPTGCRKMSHLLQPFVDDELVEEERGMVEDHLAGCPACAGEVEPQARVRDLLAELASDDAPEQLLARVRAALDAVDAGGEAELPVRPRTRLRAFGRGVGMMMPAAAAAIALFFVVRDGGPSTAEVRGLVADAAPAEASAPTFTGAQPARSLPEGVELVGADPDGVSHATHYADRRTGARYRYEWAPASERRPTGTRQMFRGVPYFLGYDAQGHRRVQLLRGDRVHSLVESSATRAPAPSVARIEDPDFRRLVRLTHALHGSGAR